jgi:hypothetical protein
MGYNMKPGSKEVDTETSFNERDKAVIKSFNKSEAEK